MPPQKSNAQRHFLGLCVTGALGFWQGHGQVAQLLSDFLKVDKRRPA